MAEWAETTGCGIVAQLYQHHARQSAETPTEGSHSTSVHRNSTRHDDGCRGSRWVLCMALPIVCYKRVASSLR